MYRYAVGIRAARGGRHRRSRTDDTKTLLLIITIVMVPTVGAALAIIASRMGPDLSDFAAMKSIADGKGILDWPVLLREGSFGLNSDPRMMVGASDCALGYMAAGDQPVRDGDQTNEFVLLPETGNLLHPAHRFGDQMIDVRLRAGGRLRFAGESLTWACGSFRALPGDPEDHKPLYVLTDADVMHVERSYITAYFVRH